MERIETEWFDGVQVQDHDDVAVHAVDALRAQAVGGVLHLERAAVGRTDHEDVLRARVVAFHRRRRQVAQVDVVDLMIEVPAVPGRSARHQHQDQHDSPADPCRRSLA